MPKNQLLIALPDASTQFVLRHSLGKIYNIVGIAKDSYAAVDSAFHLEPELVLIDIDLSFSDGINATKWIKQGDAAIKVLVFTSSTEPEQIGEIIKAGADGYCLKGVSLEELKKALAVVASGATYLAPRVKDLIWGLPTRHSLNPSNIRERDRLASCLRCRQETVKNQLSNRRKIKFESNRHLAATVISSQRN